MEVSEKELIVEEFLEVPGIFATVEVGTKLR